MSNIHYFAELLDSDHLRRLVAKVITAGNLRLAFWPDPMIKRGKRWKVQCHYDDVKEVEKLIKETTKT